MKKGIIIIMVLVLATFGFAFVGEINNFNGVSNPFTTNLTENTPTTRNINLLRYSYLQNLTVYLTINYTDFISDNFNRADSATVGNGWTDIDGGGTVNLTNNTVRISCGGSGSCQLNRLDLGDKEINFFNFDINISRINVEYFESNLRDAIGQRCVALNWGLSSSTRTLYADTSGGLQPIGNYTGNKSHSISIRDINYSSFNYSVYIDNLFNGTFGFKNSCTSIRRVQFDFGSTPQGLVFIDNVNTSNRFQLNVSVPGANYTLNDTINNTELSIPINPINNIVNKSECNINGTNCIIPFIFTSNIDSTLQVNLSNASYSLGLDSCTNSFNIPSNATALNFTIYNEETPSQLLSASLEAEVFYWTNSTYERYNYNKTYPTDTSFKLCIYPAWSIFYTDNYIKYTNPAGFTHRYYLVNETISNNTKYYDLFNFNTRVNISDLRVTVRKNSNYEIFPNVVTKLQRKYVGEGVWRTVQMDESGDFGLLFFNIKEEDTDYRLIYQDRHNNILKTTERMSFSCDGTVCEYTELLNPFSGTPISTNITFNVSTDNTTGIINVTWGDDTGKTSNVRLLVTKETLTGTSTICNINQTGSAGFMLCDTTGYTGDLLLRLYSSASPEVPQYLEWLLIFNKLQLDQLVGTNEGAFWNFGIVLTIAMAGLVSPLGAVIATIIGMVVTLFMGIFTALSFTGFIVACILGIIIGIGVRK